MENKDRLIANALKFDSLDTAEKLTGQSYKGNSAVTWLGIGLQQINSADRLRLLSETDDTTFSNELDRYLRIVEAEGFRIALRDEFEHEGKREAFYVLFHAKDGILLEFDTYGESRVNGGKFYYNWLPGFDLNDHSHLGHSVRSSGGYTKQDDGALLWAGDHDCREALRFHIRQLRTHGRFITPWKVVPYFSLLTFEEWRHVPKDWPASDEYSKMITAERVARLSGGIQAAIKPK